MASARDGREGDAEGARDKKGRWKIPASALREILAGRPERTEEPVRESGEEGRAPTTAEFACAKRRELARLNLRLARLTGDEFLVSKDRAVLERDTPVLEARDQETVRHWCNADGATPSSASA